VPDQLYVIDGSAFAYRSFFAIRSLTDSTGRPTNAVFGFTRILMKILREHEPSHIVVALDAPGKTFRADMYEAYKANRQAMPEDLVSQFPLIENVVDAFGIPKLRITGVEADDVMGTLARQGEEAGLDVVLVTSDKDALQLVTDHVRVFDPYRNDTGMWYDRQAVIERYGVPPEHVIDLLGLMGDSSDNVPGVRGIGEKTARKLLETYGSLEDLYEHLGDLKGKQRERIEEDRDCAFLSRELVTIRKDIDLPVSLEACCRTPLNAKRLADVFHELEFQKLLEEFLPDAAEEEVTDYVLVLTLDHLRRVMGKIRKAGACAVDTETTSIDPMRAELVGVSLASEPRKGYYIPIGHTKEALRCRRPDELFPDEEVAPLPREEALALLRELLGDPAVAKVGHNIKYDIVVLRRCGIEVANVVMDTMVASYLTDPSRLRHNLAEVSLQYLRRKMIPITDLIGKGSKQITFDNVPVDQACLYACEDADVTWRLSGVFRKLLHERELETLHDEVELPLLDVLARMEMAGIAIDLEVFEGLQQELAQRLQALERDIVEDAGEAFQINSPKQLQEILFGKLGLKPLRKTKTGYSTDNEVLEQLSWEHPLPAKVLEYRMLEKLRGTYVEALPKLVHPTTGRIHTSFNQAVTATGRLSSSDPNLQNIPVRTELGKRIREGFIPGTPDDRLISADYSQIELRILAHLSGDEGLLQAFSEDHDIHRATAAQIFGVSPDAVSPEMRRQAKAVNFGVVYGISPYGLARNIGISNNDAAAFIERYFARYPGVRIWIEKTLEQARRDGYCKTLLNRRRYVPEINSSDRNVRQAAERVVTNTPVQGTAADAIKVAMLRLDKALRDTPARMLLQVHDELVVEAPATMAEEVAQTVREVMESALDLNVALKVDVGIGKNWAEIH
jgi:DNA polymerase-1